LENRNQFKKENAGNEEVKQATLTSPQIKGMLCPGHKTVYTNRSFCPGGRLTDNKKDQFLENRYRSLTFIKVLVN